MYSYLVLDLYSLLVSIQCFCFLSYFLGYFFIFFVYRNAFRFPNVLVAVLCANVLIDLLSDNSITWIYLFTTNSARFPISKSVPMLFLKGPVQNKTYLLWDWKLTWWTGILSRIAVILITLVKSLTKKIIFNFSRLTTSCHRIGTLCTGFTPL